MNKSQQCSIEIVYSTVWCCRYGWFRPMLRLEDGLNTGLPYGAFWAPFLCFWRFFPVSSAKLLTFLAIYFEKVLIIFILVKMLVKIPVVMFTMVWLGGCGTYDTPYTY